MSHLHWLAAEDTLLQLKRCVSGLGRQERNARELTIGRMQHMSILPMSAQMALKSVTLVGDAGAKRIVRVMLGGEADC